MLINPFMSCSARLPVYILLIGAVFPSHMGSILFAIYLFGIVVAVIIALIFKKTFFKGEEVPFVMELPPYRIPTAISSVRHMWQKGSQYLKKMGGVILIGSILIWALGHYPVHVDYERDYEEEMTQVRERYEGFITDAPSDMERIDALNKEKEVALQQLEGSRTGEHQAKSYIGQVGRFIEPAIRPLGFDWKMGICLLSGIVAKETIVSTIGILYHSEYMTGEQESLQERIRSTQYTEGKHIGTNVFSPLVTISFVAFILLYFPCLATVTAIGRESGSWKWGAFALLYTTGLAWFVSFIIYQIGMLIGS
jgi:ferrous iron transport protein B